ncbi:conserved hypothetical protein [Burkholderia sp. IT-111MI5]
MRRPYRGSAPAALHLFSHTILLKENETTPGAAVAPHRHRGKANVQGSPAQAAPGTTSRSGRQPADPMRETYRQW